MIPPNTIKVGSLRKQDFSGIKRGIFVDLIGHSMGTLKPKYAPKNVNGNVIPNQRKVMYNRVRNGIAPEDFIIHSAKLIRKKLMYAMPGTSMDTPRTSLLLSIPPKLPYKLLADFPPLTARQA